MQQVKQPAAEYVNPATLTPWARNPRKNDPAVPAAMESIRRFGWGAPVLARHLPDGSTEIIAGHTRIKAAVRLKLAEVPVRWMDHLSDSEAHALALADNKIGELAEWDVPELTAILRDLEADGEPLDGLGWDRAELDALLGTGAPMDEGDPDDVPAVNEGDPDSVPGVVYQLGAHRLACGDSTDPGTWARLMGDERWSMLMTSPPYGQQRDYGAAKEAVQDWDRLMLGVFTASAAHAKPDGQMLVNLGLIHRDREVVRYWDGWLAAMKGAGWYTFGWYVWDQGWGLPMTGARGRLMPSHEFVFHLQLEKRGANQTVEKSAENVGAVVKSGMRRKDGTITGWSSPDASLSTHKVPDSVIRVKRDMSDVRSEHPAVYPVGLPAALIPVWTEPAEIVVEPFGGSGTTLIAAAKEGRIARVIELDPKYCDVIRRRWTKFAKENGADPGDGALA